MITAEPSIPAVAVLPDVTEVDRSSRLPLLFLVGSALVWLVLGTLLALIPSIQLVAPQFLADLEALTHGHAVALQESALLYGWAANAGMALILWLLARLGSSPLRATLWILNGAVFWNLALTVGLVGIALGDATSLPSLQLPRYVQPILLISYGAMALGGVLAWTGRSRPMTYASQWYGVAALFLFPWLFSVAQVMLCWAPVRGVLQAIVADWYVQGVWSLWLTPLALATAYYLVPKITGRLLASYEFAALGFWTLVFVGGWTGGRHLVGGPAPAWISTIAIAACSLLLFHYIVVAVNLRAAWRQGSVVLSFIAFGLGAYLLAGILDAITSVRSIARVIEFTYFVRAQSSLAFYGAIAMILTGGLYYLVPRVAGRSWASGGMVRAHFFLLVSGVLLLVINLGVAGLLQGLDFEDPKVTFAQIAAHTRPYLLFALLGRVCLFLGSLLFLFNFARTLLQGGRVTADAYLKTPATGTGFGS